LPHQYLLAINRLKLSFFSVFPANPQTVLNFSLQQAKSCLELLFMALAKLLLEEEV
jgi:hypothetical protein